MTLAIIERRFYNSNTAERSDVYALMISIIEVPTTFNLSISLRIGSTKFELESICWDANESKFYCKAKPDFLDVLSVDSPNFDEWIEWLKDDGWKFGGRFDSDSYSGDADDVAQDEEDKIRDELSLLSDVAKIEVRRRLDESSVLGKIAVAESRALEISRQQYKTKTTEAKNFNKWGFGFLILFALIDFIFPEWIKDKSAYLFLLLGLAIINFLYNEIILKELSKQIEEYRNAYDYACYRWSIVTGVRWSKIAAAAEHVTHHHSYHFDFEEEGASPSDVDKHWEVVTKSILRIVKNRYALARYDLW